MPGVTLAMTALEGAIIITGIALIVLGLIVVGREAFRRAPEDALDPEQPEEAVRATFPQDTGGRAEEPARERAEIG